MKEPDFKKRVKLIPGVTWKGLLVDSNLFQMIFPGLTVAADVFAVAGMGALFSASIRAPLTGIVLVVEMTGNYYLILPLMVCCLSATTVMQLLNSPPIYTQLLKRTLISNKSISSVK